jgi:hypothetical protein
MQSDLDYVRTRTWRGDIGYLIATLRPRRRETSDGGPRPTSSSS